MALKMDLDWRDLGGLGRYLPRPDPGRWLSGVLAVLVHALLAAFLYFGVSWSTRVPESVEVELVAAPPSAVPAPALPPKPSLPPSPPPLPAAAKPEPKPPKPHPAPQPAAEKPAPVHKADIEHKVKEKLKEPPKPLPKPEHPAKPPLKPTPKPEAKAKPEPLKPQPPNKPESKPQPKTDPKADLERQLAAEEKHVSQVKSTMAASAAADAELAQVAAMKAAKAKDKALKAWINKIALKVRPNVVVPPGASGNPEAVFLVKLLPDGAVIDVKKIKSTGNPALDDATERAIKKSEPLPKPDDPTLMVRELEFKFHPLEKND